MPSMVSQMPTTTRAADRMRPSHTTSLRGTGPRTGTSATRPATATAAAPVDAATPLLAPAVRAMAITSGPRSRGYQTGQMPARHPGSSASAVGTATTKAYPAASTATNPTAILNVSGVICNARRTGPDHHARAATEPTTRVPPITTGATLALPVGVSGREPRDRNGLIAAMNATRSIVPLIGQPPSLRGRATPRAAT